MPDWDRWTAVRWSLISFLNGFSLWILGLLVAAYASDSTLPWQSAAAVTRSVSLFAGRWLNSPMAGLPEILASLGAAVVIFGPLVEWGLKPLLARHGIDLGMPGAGWISDAGGRLWDRGRR